MTVSRKRSIHMVIIGVVVCLHALALGFIVRYTTTFPLAIDEWLHMVPRSIRLLEGETTFADFIDAKLVYDAPVQIYLYPWMLISLNVAFFDWNLLLDSFANYLLVTSSTLICTYFLSREQPKLRWYLLITTTALLLAIQQRWNLLVSIHQIHQFQIMFFMLALLFISHPSGKRLYAYLGFGMAFLGSFAMPHSWTPWVVLLPMLVMLGYRDRWVYVGYLIGVILTVIALRSVPNFSLFQNDNYFVGMESSSVLSDLGGYILFLLAYLGSVFAYGPTTNLMFPLFMGLFGLILYIINVMYLWRFAHYRRFISICTTLMLYSGMVGCMISLARMNQFGVRWGLAHHYMTASALYWVGLSGMIALSLHHMITIQDQKRVLILSNLLAVIFAVVFYINGVIGMIRVAEAHSVWVAEQEVCIVRAANGEDVGEGCDVVGGIATPEMIQAFAEYQLAGFAENRR